MQVDKNRSPDAPHPTPLEYGGADLPGDFRREADAMAGDFGGWAQIATALALGVAGALLGWLPFHSGGMGCLSMFLGVLGFSFGLFAPLPEGR